MNKLVLTLAAMTALSGAAHAERFSPITGSKLLEICTGRDRGLQQACTSYIDGISDAVTFYQQLRPENGSKGPPLPAYICVPGSLTGVRQRDAVIAWLRQHPENETRQATGIVLRAMHETFPCDNVNRG